MPSDSPVKLRSIVCAVDFSEESRDALRWAGGLAERLHSELRVVSVVDQLLAGAARIRLGQDLTAQTGSALRELEVELDRLKPELRRLLAPRP